MNVYFSDCFKVNPSVLAEYGAFNISLITDLPLFIDPFLLFNSRKKEYQTLHSNMLNYLSFLKGKASSQNVDKGLLKSWYQFSEIKQNWFGFCKKGNSGSGLGIKFAVSLHDNLGTIFSDFGVEKITHGSHIEKVCLFHEGVGRDNISDFSTNLIHEYLLEYTQKFAKKYIDPAFRRILKISNVRFNYQTETWECDEFDLPFYKGDYVLLTPKDLLTKDESWISRSDLINSMDTLPYAISDDMLRSQLNNYLLSALPEKPLKKDKQAAAAQAIAKFPQLIDYYIKMKEDRGDEAESTSLDKVNTSDQLYVEQAKTLVKMLTDTEFYENEGETYIEAFARIMFLKDTIENKDGYRLFYSKGLPIKKEQDLQILYMLTWYATPSDVNREVNNGRGPVDFKVSRGCKDKTLIEFKLASNSQLKKNLQNQVLIYEKANNTSSSIKVILYFSEKELESVTKILKELNLLGKEDIVLIDARNDNKPSASKAS
jgi:hypothetical protein